MTAQLETLAGIVRKGALEGIRWSMQGKQNPSVCETSEAVLQYGAMRELAEEFLLMEPERRLRVFDELPLSEISNLPHSVKTLCRAVGHPFDLVVCHPLVDPKELDERVPSLGLIEVKKPASNLINVSWSDSDAHILDRVATEVGSSQSAGTLRRLEWVMLVGMLNGKTVEAVRTAHETLRTQLSRLDFDALTPIDPHDPSIGTECLPRWKDGDFCYDVACFGRSVG